MTLLDRLFGEDSGPDASEIEADKQFLEWANMPQFEHFLNELRDQADLPIPIGNDTMTILEAAVRSNTLREIRSRLLREVSAARVRMDQLRRVLHADQGA